MPTRWNRLTFKKAKALLCSYKGTLGLAAFIGEEFANFCVVVDQIGLAGFIDADGCRLLR